MAWSEAPLPGLRQECHFGDRVVTCLAERPPHTDAMLRAMARAHPRREALVDGAVRLDWCSLDARIDRLAAGLRGLALARGERLALFLPNGWRFVIGLLAGIRAGLIVVPIGVRLQAPEIDVILQSAEPSAILFDADRQASLPGRAKSLRRIVADGTPAPGEFAMDALIEGGALEAGTLVPHEEDTAVILYTSGTTGTPKGAMLSHLGIVHSCLHYRLCLGLTERDRALVPVPMSHITGLIVGILAPLAAGAAIICMNEFKADRFLEMAARERMTVTLMVPAMYHLCLMRDSFERHDLGAWRVGGYGGAPMPQSTIERLEASLPGLMLANAYGATETTSPATIMPLGQTAAKKESVGRAVPCGELRIMDDDGIEVGCGQSGEIWIRGPMVVRGYWRNDEASAAAFTAGFWRSGDVGSLDADGYLRVFDRKKDMVNRAGYKVYSAEVENVLAFHKAVLDVAVVPMADPVLGEKTHAIIQIKGAPPDEAGLRAFCAERLADYKIPDRFTFLHEPLPRNANGKLMKALLRDRFA